MNDRSPDPLDVAALAELDADLPDAAEAAARRRAARADPRAAEVLDALSTTRAELAALGEPEVPAAVADRWDAAVAAERDGQAPVGPGAGDHEAGCAAPEQVAAVHGRPARLRRRMPRRRALLAVLAAAAAVAVVVGALRPGPPVLTVSRVDLVAVASEAVGTVDVGDLADPGRREGCLRAVLPDAAGQQLLGGRRVVLDGRSGVLLVLATGTRGGLRVVTVDAGCGPAGGTLIAQVTVG
jgi:hypothetical protein